MTMDLGPVGMWTFAHSWASGTLPDVAAEMEELGFGTLWLGGSPPGDLRRVESLLAATRTMPIATGIVNVWKSPARDVAEAYHRVDAAHPGRFLLGIGIGHREHTPDRYTQPYRTLVDYLDVLDAANIPADRRMLAALGPRVLTLASRRTAGAHPYLTPVEHTRRARETLGAGPLLAPELMVVLERRPEPARALAREAIGGYLQLPNYANNLRRLGYDEADIGYGGSDRLVDDLVAWGDEEAILAMVRAHLAAGADHVAVQVLNKGPERLPAHRTLAPALLGISP